jgi:hypothetical protein
VAVIDGELLPEGLPLPVGLCELLPLPDGELLCVAPELPETDAVAEVDEVLVCNRGDMVHRTAT